MSFIAAIANEAPVELTEAQIAVLLIKEGTKRAFEIALTNWSNCMSKIWGDPTKTAAVLAELGITAVDCFVLSSLLIPALESQEPGCTDDLLALIVPWTAHEDGTVTIDE
jgi:hypothetical protein